MTPEVEKKRRELYESRVVLPELVQWNEDTKSYTGANLWLAQFGWDAFNAALDAVEIELPAEFDKRDVQGLDYEEVVSAITSTDLCLKVR